MVIIETQQQFENWFNNHEKLIVPTDKGTDLGVHIFVDEFQFYINGEFECSTKCVVTAFKNFQFFKSSW